MQAVHTQPSQDTLLSLSTRAKTLLVMNDDVIVPPALMKKVGKGAIALSLSPDQNGIQMIAKLLRDYGAIDCLHIVATSRAGEVYLGNTPLTVSAIEQYSWDLQDWFTHVYSRVVRRRPQIHIHCLAGEADALNISVMNALEQLTGADVFIS